MSDVDSIVYNITLFKNINDKMQMQVELDMNNKKIINLASPTNFNDVVNLSYLNKKLVIMNIPVVRRLKIALIPSFHTIDLNEDEKIHRLSNYGDLENVVMTQTQDISKPLLKYNDTLRKYYLYFDNQNDILQSNNFSFPFEFTIFFLIKTYNRTDSIHFDFGENYRNLSMTISGTTNTLIILNSTSLNSYDVLKKINESNLNDKIELWTIRVKNNTSTNLRKMELFRGSSLTPIKSINIQNIIRGDLFLSLLNEMDFYQLLLYDSSLTDLELKYMFKYYEREYQI